VTAETNVQVMYQDVQDCYFILVYFISETISVPMHVGLLTLLT
jgi:hypothetical protein